MPKPGDFFLGLFEFFSILVPGAVVVFAATVLFPGLHTGVEGVAADWAAFLLLSYVAGHALQLPANIIDKRIYDRVYKPWFLEKKDRPEVGGQLVFSWFFDAMARIERPGKARMSRVEASAGVKGPDGPPATATKFLRLLASADELLPAERRTESTYDWAYSRVRLASEPATAEIDRLQADSKLFRSIATALPLLAVACLCLAVSVDSLRMGFAALLLLVLVSPALWRYCYLRGKATMFLYRYFILLVEAENEASSQARPASGPLQ